MNVPPPPTIAVLATKIENNLIRVNPGESTKVIDEIVREAERGWDEERQRELADAALAYYDWRAEGRRLAAAVEETRKSY